MSKCVLTVPEAADYLRIHEQSLYRLLRAGQIRGVKAGREWRIHVEALDEWLLHRDRAGITSSGPGRRLERAARLAIQDMPEVVLEDVQASGSLTYRVILSHNDRLVHVSVNRKEIDDGQAPPKIREALRPYVAGDPARPGQDQRPVAEDRAWLRTGAAEAARALHGVESEIPPGELRAFLAEIAARVRPVRWNPELGELEEVPE